MGKFLSHCVVVFKSTVVQIFCAFDMNVGFKESAAEGTNTGIKCPVSHELLSSPYSIVHRI